MHIDCWLTYQCEAVGDYYIACACRRQLRSAASTMRARLLPGCYGLSCKIKSWSVPSRLPAEALTPENPSVKQHHMTAIRNARKRTNGMHAKEETK